MSLMEILYLSQAKRITLLLHQDYLRLCFHKRSEPLNLGVTDEINNK